MVSNVLVSEVIQDFFYQQYYLIVSTSESVAARTIANSIPEHSSQLLYTWPQACCIPKQPSTPMMRSWGRRTPYLKLFKPNNLVVGGLWGSGEGLGYDM